MVMPRPRPTDIPLGIAARLQENPNDEEAYLVLADHWQARGEPLGELIALEIALEVGPSANEKERLEQRKKELFAEHGDLHLGRQSAPKGVELAWGRGFIRTITMNNDSVKTPAEHLVGALALEGAQFVQQVHMGTSVQRLLDA